LKVAGAAVASLPMIIIFVLFQQYFTRGISSGAVKE
jgi:ABC transporter, permease protein